MSATLIRGGTVVTMNSGREIVDADVRLRAGTIAEIGANLRARPDEETIDARDTFVIPGLIQAHVHLCQTLFRGLADDLELLDWLEEKIWPMENAHDQNSLRASAQLGLLEMQLSGTTAILDMGTTKLHHVVFEEANRSGIRYWGGNCLMDMKSTSGPLHQKTEEALEYSEKLIRDWHKKTPLIEYAVSPRFVISCTDKILKASRKLQETHGLIFHTHASENKGEVALVRKRTKTGNVQFLKKIGCLNEKSVIAHGIHLNAAEITDMVKSRAGLAHCPSSNLKLASGVARIHAYLKKGMKVALGSDGAPCNNQMDAFVELRLAALLQKPIFGPTALPARQAFELATLGGADVLGALDRIGSLEVGKRADVVVVKRDHAGVASVDDPYSALVYSCTGRDVRDVFIDGRAIVRDGRHRIYDRAAVNALARAELSRLRARLSD
ncbi:MAG TPA: amidohydrolase family protein [Bdellovibrionales bacterium]|nr:amidohydrolase family protein [Bdellovibrionales bacterium]